MAVKTENRRFKEVVVNRDNITDIATYLQLHATELGERIPSSFPPLQGADEDPCLSEDGFMGMAYRTANNRIGYAASA